MHIFVEFDGKEQEIALGAQMRGRMGKDGKRPKLVTMGGYLDILFMKEPERSKAIQWVLSHLAPSLSDDSNMECFDYFRETVEAFHAGMAEQRRLHEQADAENKKIADGVRAIAEMFR